MWPRGKATFALPEVGFGLVPGAGGWWCSQRIGRRRARLLALAAAIDARTAQAWGLIVRLDIRGEAGNTPKPYLSTS